MDNKDSSRMDDFNITISYPNTNKGKSITSDNLDYALYNYNLEGDFLGRENYKSREIGGDTYTSLQDYTISIQSKLKKPCTLSDFLNFEKDCVELTAKIVIGYKDVDSNDENSRK